MWRAIALVVTTALMVSGIYIYRYSHSSEEHLAEARAEFPLIDPARHFTSRDHLLSTLQPLRERLRQLVSNEKEVQIGLYFEFLNTGSNISINADERFWPASLTKVPLALAVMGTVQSNIWTLDQKLTLEESDKSDRSSTLHERPVGTAFTVQELLEEMLVRSDNTAYNILVRNVPLSQIDAVKEGLGLDLLFDESGRVSPKEFARVFRALYTASYLNRSNSQYLLAMLDRAEFTEFLREPVAATIPFPHKFGIQPEAATFNDAGIVYVPDRPYLIVVMMRGVESDSYNREHVPRLMHAISNMSLQYITDTENVGPEEAI